MSATTVNPNNVSSVSPRISTPRAGPRAFPTSATTTSQPILTTGSVPSEVTHLFRTKRVSEIRQFESRIRVDADEKSESLRHLLGTRYRDLLSAADRISSMCEDANKNVRDALQNVYTTSAQLRDQLHARATPHQISTDRQLHTSASNAPSTPSATDADLARRRSVHAVGSRLKHIVDSPEVLYACLEAGELYEAAARYVIAQRNFNAIVDAPSEEGNVASRFASARWRLVAAFKPQIIAAAERRLVTSGLDAPAYARVFAAIILLEAERCDVVSVTEKLLAARTTWLEEVRHRHGNGDASDAMRDIATVVRDTITCMAALFWQNKQKDNVIENQLDSNALNSDPQGVEDLVRGVDESCAQLVSTARERGGLNGAIVGWTSNVRSWLQTNGDALLSTATTSRQVALALKAVDDVLSQKGWSSDCHAALQQQPDFVFDIFKPFISARAAVVAEECVQLAVKRVLADIAVAWDDVSGVSDIGKGMWAAMSGQAVSLGGSDGTQERLRSSAARDLDEERDVARMLVYNGAVATVVDTLESSLKEALMDVKSLAQRVSSVTTTFDSAVGTNIPRVFNDLRQRLEAVVQEETKLNSDDRNVAMERCLFAARAATALADAECIAEALRFIAAANSMSNPSADSPSRTSRSTGLVEMKISAASVSGMGYSVWARLLCEGLAPNVMHDLTWERRLVVEMGWNGDSDHTATGQGETGVDAAVRFPTTASTAVVNMLLRACKAASKAGGFALPVEAVEFVRDAMTKIVVRVYRDALKKYTVEFDNGENSLSSGSKKIDNVDKALMQMLFDVQCLQILLGDIVVEDRRQLGSQQDIRVGAATSNSNGTTSLKQLESEIQSRIDPIDLASCRKALRESVSNYVARTGTLYGPVARRRDGRTAWAGVVRGTAHISAASNLVSIAPSVQRFTYLAAPMPSTYNSAGGVGTAGIHAKAVVGALRNEAAAASAAAASGVSAARKRESIDTSVAGYASKVSESVGRFGRGFFESLTRKVA